MIITLFGYLWLLITIFCFLSKSKKAMLFITLFSAVLQCNSVFILNNQGVGPFLINSTIFIFYYYFRLKSNGIMSIKFDKINFLLILFFGILCYSVIRLDLLQFGNKYFLELLQILIYILCFIYIKKYCKYNDININKIFVPIIWFVSIFGIIQFLIVLKILPKINIITQLFYNEISEGIAVAFHTDTRIRLYSTFMEPSYCSAFLLSAFIFVINEYKNINYSIFLSLLLIIELALTFSTTAYIGLFICLCIYIYKSKNKKILFYLIPVFIIGIVLLWASGYLDSVVFNKATSGSAYTRKILNNLAIKNFISSPFLGVGYGNSRASSLIFSLLGEIGIVGTTNFFLIVFIICKPLLKRRQNNSILLSIVAVILCLLMSIPDLSFCVFWFSLYLYAIIANKIKVEKNNE